jgi:DNA-binding NtrC family response regulator
MSLGKTISVRSSGVPLEALRIQVTAGPDAGVIHTAESATAVIGTAPGNDLVLTDETVSRFHLEIELRGDRIHVRDLGSTNGTQVGAALIDSGTIAPGTSLTIGRTSLRIDGGGTARVELYEGERLGRLRGRSPEMRRLMATIDRAAESDVSVLILGETGTGKEVVAHAIHHGGRRSAQPIETVDCGALLPTLIASELFGHEKGAFTGADKPYVGAFERAHEGTIFLDEVGELPLSLQPALLGVLERKKFRRLGGEKQIAVDVRILGATNRDLRSAVNAGTFRQDLYYRIAALLVRVPPLRERTADIPLLVEHFLSEAGFHGDPEEIISPSVMRMLEARPWPGNVRELRNFVVTALAIGEPPPPEDTVDQPAREGALDEHTPSVGGILVPPGLSYDRSLDYLQRRLIEHAMKEAKNAVGKAAELLGVERSRLSKLRQRLRVSPR